MTPPDSADLDLPPRHLAWHRLSGLGDCRSGLGLRPFRSLSRQTVKTNALGFDLARLDRVPWVLYPSNLRVSVEYESQAPLVSAAGI
jgi:hypothetical protein